jgi:hypothetical protein
MSKLKEAANNPKSMWVSMAAIAAAVLAGIGEGRTLSDSLSQFATTSEASHYEAIVDLRQKMDYLFGKIVELDKRTTTVMAPGPAQPAPPDAGSTEPTDVVESDAAPTATPSPPEGPKPAKPSAQQPPFQCDEYGNIEWAPIQRPKLGE